MLSHALYENAFSTPVPCISIHSQTCIKLPLPLFVEIGPVILKRKNELEARRGFKQCLGARFGGECAEQA